MCIIADKFTVVSFLEALVDSVGKGSSSAGDKDPEPERSHGRELMGRAAAPVPCGCLNTAHGVAVLHRYFGGSASLFLDENLDIFVN